MTLWDNVCCFGYGLQARYDAMWHLLRGHKLRWRYQPNLWIGCTGDILCSKCPDTKDKTDLVLWCRHNRWLNWLTQKLCALLGHPELRHPKVWNGVEPVEDNMVDIEHKWYCSKCLADEDQL